MLKQTELLEIISRKRNGLVPSAIRVGLFCLTPIYRLAIGFRNRKFNKAVTTNDQQVIRAASIPVVSVGNLTTGGTGKTPLVIWIAKYLRSQNKRVALISRGYGGNKQSGQTSGRNDEALEMEHRLPDVPHLQDPDRYQMSQIAEQELESEVLVLDDAFQHRQFHRDLDIVLIDATAPFGLGYLLPRGLLREPISSLGRCDFVILTRTNLVTAEQLAQTTKKIQSQIPDHPIAQTQTVPTELLRFDGKTFPLDELDGQSILQLCAIGNPDNFRLTLDRLKMKITATKIFDDHHQFTRDELESVGDLANQSNATVIVCTHKDLVKIGTNQICGVPVYAILIDVQFLSGQSEFENMLGQLLAAK